MLLKLVAETGADRDLVAALGAAARKHRGSTLGLHAAKEAVGFRTAAAVGLKGTLGHDASPAIYLEFPVYLLTQQCASAHRQRMAARNIFYLRAAMRPRASQ
jgi:hypothetical protein